MTNMYAYADESNWNKGRYRSLALITVAAYNVHIITNIILENKIKYNIRGEVKWSKMDGYNKINYLIDCIGAILCEVCNNKLRIDVIVWDTYDQRHKIRKRDDVANLERMYYHLLYNVCKRWNLYNRKWYIYPDEMNGIEWTELTKFLSLKNIITTKIYNVQSVDNNDIFGLSEVELMFIKKIHIENIIQCDSKDEPLIQFADVIAGVAQYSHNNYNKYEIWCSKNKEQGVLFEENVVDKSSNRDKYRFKLMQKLDGLFKKHSMTVSLRTNRGFVTNNPNKGINFWLYQPQGVYDKAPTKTDR